MDKFDLDDPLGDLLSEGSNDSFFDDPKTVAKRDSISKTPEKKLVSDLFGLPSKTEEPKLDANNDNWLGVDLSRKANENPLTVSNEKQNAPKAQKKISFEDDDILDNLNLEPVKPKQDESFKIDPIKKTTIMDSIRGPLKDDKKFLSLDDLLQESKLNKKPSIAPAEVTQSTSQIAQKMDQQTFGFSSLDTPRESRRSRSGKSIGFSDPLGLFSTDTKPVESEPIIATQNIVSKDSEIKVIYPLKPAKSSSDLIPSVPDWLGGSGTILKQSSSEEVEQSSTRLKSEQKSIMENPEINYVNPDTNLNTLMTQQQLATSHIEYQNTSMALQQQESQLLMSLQLKKYEEKLVEMQTKQQDILLKQENQFYSLLERQFAKQQMLENNMRLQQERINNHIQMLIAQPVVPNLIQSNDGINDENIKYNEFKKHASEDTVKDFEELIEQLKRRQQEEVLLLEDSYKKQISTLEQSMDSVENHLKMELDSLMQKHREKLDQIDQEHSDEISKYKLKIEELRKAHAEEIKTIRDGQNRAIEEIRYEYSSVIENMKLSKSSEAALQNDGGMYAQKLDASLKLLNINSLSIIDIKTKVDSDYGVLASAREESLKAKEEEIKMMREALERVRASADEERSQLMSLVRSLELKLAEQSQISREERFALQQATAILTARSTALDREIDYNKASVEREREQLKTMRESILTEQEKQLLQLTEEKLIVQSERSRLETARKLNLTNDVQRMARSEIEAAVQVAREAAEATDKERERLYTQQNELEKLKRTLLDRQRKLELKEREIDELIRQADMKALAGEKALEESKMIQVRYSLQLREIQAQLHTLSVREKKLSEEKIALSHERVNFQNTLANQKPRCGLCNASDSMARMEFTINADDRQSSEREFILADGVQNVVERFNSDADRFRMQLLMSEEQLVSMHGDARLSNV